MNESYDENGVIDDHPTDPLAIHQRAIAEGVAQEVYISMALEELDKHREALNESYEKDKAELIRTGSMGVRDKGLEDYYGEMHDANKVEYQALMAGKVDPEDARKFLRGHGDEYIERVAIAEKQVPNRAAQAMALEGADAELEVLEQKLSDAVEKRAGNRGRFPGRDGLERGMRAEMPEFAAVERKRAKIVAGDFGTKFDQNQVDLRKQFVEELYSFEGDDRGLMQIQGRYERQGLEDSTPPDDLYSRNYSENMDAILAERIKSR